MATDEPQRRAIVVGGGIAGLASAIALKKRGWEVTVLEQHTQLREIGAGITLQPNAVECLRIIDQTTAARVHEVSYEVGDINSFTLNGAHLDSSRTRSTLYRAELQEHFQHPVWMVHRGELVEVLGREFVGEDGRGGGEVRTNVRVERVETDGKTATVYGTNGFQEQAELVIGADGLHSIVRALSLEQLHGEGFRELLRVNGVVAWRGVAELQIDDENDTVGQSWGLGLTTGLFVMTHNRCYWWVTQPLSAQGRAFPDHKAHLLAILPAECHPHIRQCIEATQNIRCDEIYDRLPIPPPWGFGNITLVGDAAHPCTPYLGQGAAQAFEDVASLVLHLEQDGVTDVASTLRAFERVRYPKSSAITNTAWTFGRILGARSRLGTQLSYFFVKHIASLVHWRQLRWILTPSINPDPSVPSISPSRRNLNMMLFVAIVAGSTVWALHQHKPAVSTNLARFARFYK